MDLKKIYKNKINIGAITTYSATKGTCILHPTFVNFHNDILNDKLGINTDFSSTIYDTSKQAEDSLLHMFNKYKSFLTDIRNKSPEVIKLINRNNTVYEGENVFSQRDIDPKTKQLISYLPSDEIHVFINNFEIGKVEIDRPISLSKQASFVSQEYATNNFFKVNKHLFDDEDYFYVEKRLSLLSDLKKGVAEVISKFNLFVDKLTDN